MDPALFGTVSSACKQAIELQDQRAAGSGPRALCHLTDTDGFMGIVASHDLWACLVTESNDASELRHGRALAVQILEERLHRRADPLDEAILSFVVDPSQAPPRLRYELGPLAISFCENCDKSGHWLHYGRSGRGVALVFAPELARSIKLDLAKVEYDLTVQRSRIIELLDAGRAALGSAQAHVDAAQAIALWVTWLALRLKHPSFSEEREWRLCGMVTVHENAVADGTALAYRRTGERVVPYEPHSFAPAMLTDAIVGYSSALTPEAARLFLVTNGFTASASRSTVPVR